MSNRIAPRSNQFRNNNNSKQPTPAAAEAGGVTGETK